MTQSNRNVQQELADLVKANPVVLFMKGSKSFPQCGFSATVVQILSSILSDFQTVNVLSDPEIRQGVKEFSNWPTIPQLYVNGEFVGGCDIVRDMFQSGELHKVLGVDTTGVTAPRVTVTDRAAEVLRNALADADAGEVVHLDVDARFRSDLHIGPKGASDVPAEGASVELVVGLASVARADGVTIDFVEERGQAGFKIDNPNAPANVIQIGAEELKQKLDAGEIQELFDVRTPEERAKASIAGARHLDDEAVKHLQGLDRNTPIAFHCHRGGRSQAAAEHFRDQGFRTVYNLAGGIDAWSMLVDPSVPRY